MPTSVPVRRSDRAAGRVAFAALVVTLLLSWAGKAVCVDGEEGFWGVTRYCYSDVRVLWDHRGYDVGSLPYRDPPPDYPVEYTTEYPPGLAFPAWGLSLVTDSRAGFFHLNALTFALAALLTLHWLDRTLIEQQRGGWPGSRWRLLGFSLSPALVLFGMQNWDLWVLVPVAIGLADAVRGRSVRAAVWFGIGAAIKWWPALLIVVLLAGRWRPPAPPPDAALWRILLAGHWRDGSVDAEGRGPELRDVLGLDLRPALAGAGAWAAVQLPAIVVSPTGWWDAIAFHLRRLPNWDSTAMAMREVGMRLLPGAFWGDAYARTWTVLSLVVLVTALGVIGRRLHRGRLHPVDGALAALAIFLVVGKVFSPQFVLWLLPLAVVARVSWTPVVAVEASNAAVWLLYGPWMGLWHEDDAFQGFLYAAQGMSAVRTAALVWLAAAALAAGTSARREDAGSARREDAGSARREDAGSARREDADERDHESDDRGDEGAEAALPEVPGGQE